VPPRLTVDDLIAKAVAHGFKQSDIVTAAKIYHQQPNIYHLTTEQINDLDRRMTAKLEKLQEASVSVPSEETFSMRNGRLRRTGS
jgi:hypothetical protein